jgi:CheY-like chemotaxis protein
MNLLVVSAHPDLARLLSAVLPDEAWTVTGAGSAQEGLRTLVRHAPDVLYVDAHLQDMAALVRAVRRVPRGDETLIVLVGGDVALPEADRHVPARTAVLDLVDLARAEESRRASGAPRHRHVRGALPPRVPDPVETDAPTRPFNSNRPSPPALHTDAPTRPFEDPSPAPQGGPSAETELLRKRLVQEIRAVETADHWAVLAIPRGAGTDVVNRAVRRMRERYGALATHPDGGIRRLAATMLARVEGAERAVRVTATETVHDRRAVPDVPVDAVRTGPFDEGHALLRAERWADAEAWFTAARDRHAGESVVLAGLGWAHANNPSAHVDTRRRAGQELLEVALRFDPSLADAHAWLGAVFVLKGDHTRARPPLEEALRLAPGHADATRWKARLRG